MGRHMKTSVLIFSGLIAELWCLFESYKNIVL